MAYRDGTISEPAKIEALASPVRQEIIDTFTLLGGQATVAELAEQLGRPADGLYYHLRLLRRAGLIRDAAGTSDERRFELTMDSPPRLVYRPAERRNRAAVRQVAHGLLQIAQRDFEAALTAPDAVVEGPQRTLWAARNKGWVSAAELAEINRLLTRLCDLLHRPRSARRDTLVGLAFALSPLPARPKRRVRD